MANALPISLEILACFIVATLLLNRYSDMVNNNIVTLVGVFVSWFFSFIIIFLLPADLTSTAYRQCLFDHANSNASTPIPINATTTTITTLAPSISPQPGVIPQHENFAYPSMDNIALLRDPNIASTCIIPWSYVLDSTLTKLWRSIYWTSQLLTWLILPIMQSYSMAGDFTTKDKLKHAFTANLIYYSSYAAIFSVLTTYVIFTNGLDFANLKVIVITSSNTWGLFVLVVLLGYGLVELPRYIINQSRNFQSLSRQYFRVARLNAEKCEAEEKLDDVLEEIHHCVTVIGSSEHNPLKKYLDQIIDKCPSDWQKRSNAFRRQAAASNSIYEADRTKTQDYDLQSLIRLNKKTIKAVHYHRQITCRWNHLIAEVIDCEDVIRNQIENIGSHSARLYKSTLPKKRSMFSSIYTPRVEWYWRCLIKIWILRIFGFMLAIFSLAVVWSEIAFPLSIFSTKLSVFAYFVDSFRLAQQHFYLELFSIVSIGYLAVCAFYTVFHMKICNIYYLASNKQTDEYSLLFSGMLLCRLTAPICLNYLCLVNFDSHIFKKSSILETSFTTIMGHLDLIPVVNSGLNIFLPLCISAICLAIYFDFGTRMLHTLGFEQFIESDEMTSDWVQTGRDLVSREKNKLLRNYESTSVSYREVAAPSSIDTRPDEMPMRGSAAQQLTALKDDGGSPTSQTSSSSGISRSSLIPKVRSSQPSGRDSNNPISHGPVADIIEIDMKTGQDESKTSQQPKGFFDDV